MKGKGSRISSITLKRTLVVSLALLVCALAARSVDARETTEVAPEDAIFGDPLFDNAEAGGFPDPLERLNRGTLAVNQQLDRWIIDPVADLYRFVVPTPVRNTVRRVLGNLNAPVVTMNDVLQREWRDAGVTVTRFALNTTVGLAGIFDPASDFGLEAHHSDFGQTMALVGVDSGPFLVLPVLGPTTARDGVGFLIDTAFRPTTYVLAGADQLVFSTIYGGSSGLAARDTHADGLRLLEESSIDYYAALRNAYYQNRMAEIWARRAQRQGADEASDSDLLARR